MRRPICVNATGGGVWRVKWHPSDPSLLAVACMHEGFQILRWSVDGSLEAESGPDSVKLETVVRYKGKHESLGYGIDWSYSTTTSSRADDTGGAKQEKTEKLVASCSFYDHLLTLWKVAL